MVDATQQPIEVFFSYSREDKPLRDKLEIHLSSLKRQGVISSWHDRQIIAGSEWEEEIDRHMQTADVILLLISPDFVNSEYCYDIELPVAMARHKAGEAFVVPILLRPVVGWKSLPFANLQVYPSGGKPITQWSHEDDAFVDVGEGILVAVRQLLEKRVQVQQERQEQVRREEQARLVEQARIRAAEQEAEQQRQVAAEKTKQAERAREAERQRREEYEQRQARLRQIAGTLDGIGVEDRRTKEEVDASVAARSRFMNAPDPLRQQVVEQTRRQALKWLGYGVGAFALTVVGKSVFDDRRSSPPSPSPSPSSANPSVPDLEDFSFGVATVNKQGQESPRQTLKARHFVENLGNGVTLQMVAIPGGTFQMGSPTTEKDRDDDESPQHSAEISEFSMGRYAVTQAQYEAVMGQNPSHFKGAKRPVDQVSWNDAQKFCKKLSQETGRTYRLPSEAEWEYACRAETTTPFNFGETMTSAVANYNATSTYQSEPKGEYRKQTTDVGIFPANRFGLCDMHGNVWEWCEDIYHKNYEGAPTDGSAWNIGGDKDLRVLRGGSWVFNPWSCRSASRGRNVAGFRLFNFGFRVVCSAPLKIVY
jgi:formylglycine-generating enzyme required for sulfatase activity